MKTLLIILLFAVNSFAVNIYIPEGMEADVGDVFDVPVYAQDVSGVFAVDLNIVFDPNIAKPKGSNFGCSTGTDLEINCNVIGNTLLVSMFGAYPIQEDGELLSVQFKAVKAGDTPFVFTLNNLFNQYGLVKTEATNGFLTVH